MKPSFSALSKLALDPVFRHRYLARRRADLAQRFGDGTLPHQGGRLLVRNSHDFGLLYEEIYLHRIYDFETTVDNPVLIDGGANIGLATLRWKSLYPHAKVFTFEPDPENFAVLQRNLTAYGCTEVTAIQAAISHQAGPARLVQDARLSSHLAAPNDSSGGMTVDCVRLKDFLDQPIDFLKLDIEGAELDVLADCEAELPVVRRLFVEYHSYAGQPQRLDELLGILRRTGFRCWLHGIDVPDQPFQRARMPDGELDMCVNVFGTRP